MTRRLHLVAVLLAATATVFAQDDSVFEKDPRLRQSLWGIAYTPPNAAYYPNCGDTLPAIVKDVQLMSQLSTRLRLYGADCGQTDLILNALQRTKVNMQVFLGIFLDGTALTYARQLNETITALRTYGTNNVAGITVGNEYILQQVTAGNAQTTATAYVAAQVTDVKAQIAALNLDKAIPIGTADAGSMITPELAAAADYVMANTHPFFSGVTIDGAADWTAQYLVNDEPRFVTQAGKTLYNAEIGWPTAADSGGSLTLNGSAATLPNAQILLDTFVCAANANNTNGYFWFEFADGEWKKQYGGAEPYWGLFDFNRNFKNLQIPDCPATPADTPGATTAGPTGTGGGSSNPTGTGTGTGSGSSPTGGNRPGDALPRWSGVSSGALGLLVAVAVAAMAL